MMVAGKQVINRPTILFEVIGKAKLGNIWVNNEHEERVAPPRAEAIRQNQETPMPFATDTVTNRYGDDGIDLFNWGLSPAMS